MASRMCMAVAMAMALFVVGATAQLDCTMALNSLTPCMTYVTGPTATPDQVCCDGIRNVNTNSPACLCQVIAGLNAKPSVNQTKVNGLPRDCNVQVNTASCPAFNAPPLPLMPPPLPSSMPPLPTSMPPGVSIPPGVSAPPLPTSMPPLAAPPTVALPPSVVIPPPMSAPELAPASAPMMSPPTLAPPAVPAMGPGSAVPALGPGSASSGAPPAPTPASSEGSALSASMAFAAALTGAVVSFVF